MSNKGSILSHEVPNLSNDVSILSHDVSNLFHKDTNLSYEFSNLPNQVDKVQYGGQWSQNLNMLTAAKKVLSIHEIL